MFSLIELVCVALVVAYGWKHGWWAKAWAWVKSKVSKAPVATASKAANTGETNPKTGRPV